ncbi:LysM domain [Orobanche minor]
MKQMISPRFISAISIILISCFPIVLAQQPYIHGATALCDSRDNSTSVLGYTCNGPRPTCQAYLTFRAQTPYTSVSTISNLLSVNSSQLSQLNSVPGNTTFETNQTVLIPVTCSCSGEHFQFNASYVVRQGDTYLAVASNTFQGLSTCQALQAQNTIPAEDLFPGASITVPLRCACPTRNQSGNGVNYLLSYLIAPNQFISTISERFGASTAGTLAANGLSETDIIYPSTTLLVPLHDPPTSSQVTAPQPPPPPPPSPTTPTSSHSSSKTWIYTAVGVAGGLFLVGAVVFCLFFLKKKKKKQREADIFVSSQSFESVEKQSTRKERDDEEDSRGFLESISTIAQSLKVYTFEELRAATEDFSPNSRIKGSVYCGTINGDSAAVKKMIDGDVSEEISLLNKLNHFNLIRLSGVGFNEGIWYLVYEYASNGSLHDWITNKSEEKTMDWDRRLQVAMDIAAGLNYLHRYASPPYVHKNLNSNNVLLDRDFRAKIANFGQARSAEGREGQFALTRHVIGTKGYMAPEYLENGVVSPELDVYAFGVLLMEILTGKEVSLLLYEGVNMQLSEILTPVLSADDGNQNLRKLMDPMLQGKYPRDLALVLFGLIGSCLKKDPLDRPNMDDIFKSLSKISTTSSSMSSE